MLNYNIFLNNIVEKYNLNVRSSKTSNNGYIVRPTSGTKKDYYIYGGDGIAAIYRIKGANLNGSMFYIHKDNLGSFDKVTDESGDLVDSYNFDAWGNRRNPNDWTQADGTIHLFDRGYTGHEHLDKFGLINMNGRCYDPLLGRFLSPDPFIQAPGNTQNYNRYTYCLNNPFAFTDPSGFNYSGSTPMSGDPNSRLVGGHIANSTLYTSNFRCEWGMENWNYNEYGMPDFIYGENGADVISGSTSGEYYRISKETYLWGYWCHKDGSGNMVRETVNPEIYEQRLVYTLFNPKFKVDPLKGANNKVLEAYQKVKDIINVLNTKYGLRLAGYSASLRGAFGPLGYLRENGYITDNYGNSKVFYSDGWCFGLEYSGGYSFYLMPYNFQVDDFQGKSFQINYNLPSIYKKLGIGVSLNYDVIHGAEDDVYGTRYKGNIVSVGIGYGGTFSLTNTTFNYVGSFTNWLNIWH